MKRKISLLEVRARQVLSINLADKIKDEPLLVAVLFACQLDEIYWTLSHYAAESMPVRAAIRAVRLHNDREQFNQAVKNGFFATALMELMMLAQDDHDLGARMMPAFCNFATWHAELGISEEQQKCLIDIMEFQRAVDGFAIKEIENGNVTLIPADDVVEG